MANRPPTAPSLYIRNANISLLVARCGAFLGPHMNSGHDLNQGFRENPKHHGACDG